MTKGRVITEMSIMAIARRAPLVQLRIAHATLEIVDSMHVRKKRMADLADAFIAMPGGWGTLDELAEILTWRQLGLVKVRLACSTQHYFQPADRATPTDDFEGFAK